MYEPVSAEPVVVARLQSPVSNLPPRQKRERERCAKAIPIFHLISRFAPTKVRRISTTSNKRKTKGGANSFRSLTINVVALAQLLNHLLTVITTITVRSSNNTKRKDAIHFKTETVFECNRCRCSDSSDISKGIRGALVIFFSYPTPLTPSSTPSPPRILSR